MNTKKNIIELIYPKFKIDREELLQFNDAIETFSVHNGFVSHALSFLVYFSQPFIENTFQSFKETKVVCINKKHLFAIVCYTDKTVSVAFRGTNDIYDCLTDITLNKIRKYKGKVHQGFDRALDVVWEDLTKTVLPLLEGRKLLFTGHSMGGAMATLASIRFLEEHSIKADVIYTFGSPRVGNRSFATNYDEHFEECHFRFVNYRDLVTRVPAVAWGFCHVGTLKYFDEKGGIQVSDSFSGRILNSFTDLKRYINLQTPNLLDHFMDKYMKRFTSLKEMKKLLTEQEIEDLSATSEVSGIKE